MSRAAARKCTDQEITPARGRYRRGATAAQQRDSEAAPPAAAVGVERSAV